MAAQLAKQTPRRPRVGDVVWHWHRGSHAIVALGIRHEFSAVVVHGDVVVDPAVQAIRRRVPHVDDSAGERLARVRAHRTANDQRFVVVGIRSEEHTSELQSLMRISYAVFCLTNKTKNSNIHEPTRHSTYRQ